VSTADTVSAPPKRKRRQPAASVLYDVPGPRARIRNNVLTLVSLIVFAVVAYAVVRRMGTAGQWQASLWEPFTRADVWVNTILPGLWGTLSVSAVAAVLALAFGVVFGFGRMSDHRWIRVVCGAVVECFRAIPVLLLIFFIQAGPATINIAFGRIPVPIPAFWAVAIGLMLYNGSVLAEVFRAGINAVPRGQGEAAYALGLRKGGVMRLILLPQAVTAMMPAIVSQLVILLKDSALGWIISYPDLLNAAFRQVGANFGNALAAAIVVAVMYILINLALSYLANWLERRNRRSRKTSARTVTAPTQPGDPAAPL
jgi:glutamate transport system permease protein